MKGSISLELTDSLKEIEAMLTKQIADILNSILPKNTKKATKKLQSYIKQWIQEQPEIKSLQNGGPNSLTAIFGLQPSDSANVVQDIINEVVGAISIDIKKIDKNLNGSIIFNIQPIDMKNLLTLRSGHVITEKQADLHWLDWLLTKGDTIIIANYSYTPSKPGRSGGGSMKPGGSFRVPPQFSGNLSNNFITRAFEGREKQIKEILEELFQ